MSQKDVRQVIGRIAAYADYRRLLTINPRRALKSYNLTSEEQNALKDIARSRFKLDIDDEGHIELVS